jgi:hypothetical protein
MEWADSIATARHKTGAGRYTTVCVYLFYFVCVHICDVYATRRHLYRGYSLKSQVSSTEATASEAKPDAPSLTEFLDSAKVVRAVALQRAGGAGCAIAELRVVLAQPQEFVAH